MRGWKKWQIQWESASYRRAGHGKKPTLAQKKFLQDTGLDSEKWLIVKDTPEEMVIVSKIALQRRSGKTKTIRKAKK